MHSKVHETNETLFLPSPRSFLDCSRKLGRRHPANPHIPSSNSTVFTKRPGTHSSPEKEVILTISFFLGGVIFVGMNQNGLTGHISPEDFCIFAGMKSPLCA